MVSVMRRWDSLPTGVLASVARPLRSPMADGRRPRVLVIDDDPSVREIVRYLLEDFGYDCETAADGPRGLARFQEGGWDLVVTDLGMPEMSGWEVVEAIRRRSLTMPIVLITGLIDPGLMRRAGEQGLPVVPKPFRSDTLRAAVAEALRARPSPQASFPSQG
jgi:CheY-like chemotaxis protein